MQNKASPKKRPLYVIVVFCFFLLVAVSVLLNQLPSLILVLYVIFSLLTFIMYAIDKSAAKKGKWRTKENTLHLLSLMGGWPGALIAQAKLRHKSRKTSFRLVFWVTVCLNVMILIWLSTPAGSSFLAALISLIT
jgi:uncharacterized membrane protein YsdA (DUF1294 family)